MGVTVDQARHRAPARAVELLDLGEVADNLRELAHPPDCLDPLAVAENERIVQYLDGREVVAAARQLPTPAGRDELGKPADEEPSHGR
jgi:phage terminase small subunit